MSYNNSYGGLFKGRPDAYNSMTGSLWELKPSTDGSGSGYAAAKRQLGRYLSSSNGNPRRQGPMSYPGSWEALYEGQSSVSQDNYRYYPDNTPNSGIIFYDCEPEPQMCSIGEQPFSVFPPLF